MKSLRWPYLSILFLLLAQGPAGAGETAGAGSPGQDQSVLMELDIEDLTRMKVTTVYAASRYEQKVTEAPSSVSIVTAAEIKKYGYRTLADIIRSVRSFYVTYDRNYSYIGVRGFGRPGDYNSRILILIDGHRLNDNVYDSVLVGTEFPLDMDLVERVEVIRGPGSSLYGSNAFFAVVNVVTRSGRNVKGVELSGAAGSFETYQGRLSYGSEFRNGMEALFSGSFSDSQGQRLYYKEFDPANPLHDPRAANNGITEDTDYDRSQNYFTKVSYRGFTLEGASVTRTKGIPTGAFGIDFNDPGNRTVDTRRFLDLKYAHPAGAQSNVMARLFYDYYDYRGDYLYGGVVNKDLGHGEWWGGELKYETTMLEKHKIVFGGEYQDNIVQRQSNYDEYPYFLYGYDNRNSELWALYLQDEFAISQKLVFTAGLRYDYYSTFGDSANPRLALIYHPVEKTSLKLLYGTAFRAPSDFELYFQTPVLMFKANPDLEPETIKTCELVYEQYLGNHLRATADGFYYRIKDLISQTIDPADNFIVFSNVEKVEAKGLELELDGAWANGFEGRISYTLQKSKNLLTGETLTNSPEQLLKANLTVPLIPKKLFAGIEEQYTGRTKTLQGTHAGSFFVTNVTLFSRDILKNLELSASVHNVFDKEYGYPGSVEHVQDVITQDGRNYRVKLTYSF